MEKSEKTIALIGCGGWGKNLARNLHELGALAAIIDPSPQSEQLAASLGVSHSSGSKAALADAAITAVVVASPAATHARVAAEALAAGKDVFVEKPIALRAGEARELQRLAAAHSRILMVGHLLQYHTGFLKLMEIARSGSLGHIRHMTSSRLNLGLIRSEENVVWSFAPHDISMLLAIAGALPERVSAVGTTVLQEGIPDIATVHMQFAGGLKADVTISWLHPQKEQQLIVVGDDGMAVFADTKPWPEKLRIHRNKVSWADNRPKAAPGPVEAIPLEQSEPLKEEMRHFLHCVATREKPRTHVEEAIGVLAVLEAAQASLDNGGNWQRIVTSEPLDHVSALLQACALNETERVLQLLSQGADANTADGQGRSALMVVCRNGNATLAEALLKHGADPNGRNVRGTTPLMYAKTAMLGGGNSEIMDVLLSYGADLSLRDNAGLDVGDYVELRHRQMKDYLANVGQES